MITDGGDFLNNHRDSRQSPKLGAESMRPSAVSERKIELIKLSAAQLGQSAGPPGALKRFRAFLFPCVPPSACALSADSQILRDGCHDFARRKHLRCLLSSLSEFCKVASYNHVRSHTQNIRERL